MNAERSGLSVSLEASRSTASDLEVDRATLSNELNNVQTQLVRAETSLASTEERAHNLQVRVLGLQESQRDLTAAVGLLSELEDLNNSQYWPNRGDALLLVEEGHRAANQDNFAEAAKFFGESSRAFDLAKANVEELTNKSEELADLVPDDANQVFVDSHRRARSTVFAMEAQARTYEAADQLYRIIGEWFDTEEPTSSDRARWGELADMAEDQFELAMGALDEADTWSPGPLAPNGSSATEHSRLAEPACGHPLQHHRRPRPRSGLRHPAPRQQGLHLIDGGPCDVKEQVTCQSLRHCGSYDFGVHRTAELALQRGHRKVQYATRHDVLESTPGQYSR